MKTIIMRTEKSSRWAAMLLATAVAIITCLAVANATQTITTPNAAFISYNLAGGANSAAITPAAGKSVLVMGCSKEGTGVGFVSLFVIPSGSSSVGVVWAGLESQSGGSTTTTTAGSTSTAAHIVYIDSSHQVDIQVASATTILIHNGSAGTRTGNVTLIW
jgi:hypothetical protein